MSPLLSMRAPVSVYLARPELGRVEARVPQPVGT
jgi:hypothetical protein